MAFDKASAADESGFLSRWSQRKQALRKGEPLVEPEEPKISEDLEVKRPIAGINTAPNAPDLIVSQESIPHEEKPPAPTMQDVHGLTPESDFKPFMRADVSPDVKNAAMKQLFKDPHFNVMDMMDVYVDDYSKPDPLPPEMLRKMAVTQFLGFWKEEEEQEKAEAEKKAAEEKAREDAKAKSQQTVAQSELENTTPELTEESQAVAPVATASQAEHDHPDLQLQPDDAAGRQGALRSAG